eukprot:CAMPEP_0168367692 /NCGR_PEP_ID=MMETSP0228-20121227/5869_1 /TAXON_ID=133427 /ORGANISM="Protoceratium reticulatum, Strain CCCM 535 (=CCMP 1889)" /LENGTH=35 /DNA_ID= /DNA_START= /DNA_END= /DNA_ORIENTATION=
MGVTWDKNSRRRGRWRLRAQINGKRYGGRFHPRNS